MSKILQLHKKRGQIEIETNEERFTVDEETVIHYRLLKGTDITPELRTQIEAFDSFAKGLAKAYHYLSFKPRSVAQMKLYLKEKEILAVERIIEELKRKGYLDDLATARLIKDQVLAQAKGPQVIRRKLVEAKLHPSIIDQVIQEIDVDPNQVEKRFRQYLKPSSKSKRAYLASLTQKMLAAGFHYDNIQQLLAEYQTEIASMVDEAKGISTFLQKNKQLSPQQQLKKLLAQGYDYGLVQRMIQENHDE